MQVDTYNKALNPEGLKARLFSLPLNSHPNILNLFDSAKFTYSH